MAPKTHRSAPGLTRNSRSTSGGSSKVGLNLHFTQKDPSLAKKPKSTTGNGRHESPARTAPYPPRTNSDLRIQSKLGTATNAVRTVSNSTQRPPKSKPDFTISHSDGDDDEWVSSSSGPVTPNNQSSDEDDDSASPIEPPTPVDISRFTQAAFNTVGNEAATPRAGLPSAAIPPSQVEPINTPPARPVQKPQIAEIPQLKPQPQKTEMPVRLEDRVRDQGIIEIQHIPRKLPPVKQVRSETNSPPSPPQNRTSHRQSSTRPPSLHSINTKSDVRPHPLIRGQSFGLGTPTTTRPAPLAPLTTIPAKEALGLGLLSSSPPIHSPRLGHPSPSPAPSLQPSLRVHDDSSEARKQLRRQSTSSQVSNVTVPSTPSRTAHQDRRQRTMSTMSTSSSVAALSSLAYTHHHNSPPRSPATGFVSHFPSMEDTDDASETIHMLLPPPYLTAHLTILAHRSPMRESYERVLRAKRNQ